LDYGYDRTPPRPLTLPRDFDLVFDIDAIAADWRRFETEAIGSLYQTYLWCRAWQDTVGAALGTEPVIVVLRDADGDMLALLPLQIRRRHGLRILEWLASSSNNYGFGLYHARFAARAGEWLRLNWPEIVRRIGRIDAVALRDNPDRLSGHVNPMDGMFTTRGANRSYALTLQDDYASLYAARREGESRRAARKKDRALSRLGSVSFGLPASLADTHATLEQMFKLQECRLAEHGIRNVFSAEERAFIHRLADLQDPDKPLLAPYTLKLDGDVIATFLGGLHGETFWALISSLGAGPQRKCSPGDAALRGSIEACCKAGLKTYDFSAGASRYKLNWADVTIQLHDIIAPVTLRGLAYAWPLRVAIAGKRTIKENPALLDQIGRARRLVFGKSPVRPT
jgi:CelD/BcsL family acetyltransferase involved in cellulose biosynthesis